MRVLKRLSLYTLLAAIFWIGAFGIAYGVVEWRGETGPPGREGLAGPPGEEATPDRCSEALAALGNSGGAIIGTQLYLRELVDHYCPD